MPKFISHNEKDTLRFAANLARRLQGGAVLLLQGDLGAGKTTFVRGLATALGVRERIKSPTFTLMRAHQIKNVKYKIKNLVHCDAYRINAHALLDIGLIDYIDQPQTIVIVEWGEKIKPLLTGRRYMTIKFQHGKKENERLLTLQPRKLLPP